MNLKQCAIAGCQEYAENDWRVTFDTGESEVIPVCDAHSSDRRVAGQWAIVKDTKLIAGRRERS